MNKLLLAYTLTLTPCFSMIDRAGTNINIYQINDSTKLEVWHKADSLMLYRKIKIKVK